MEKIDVNTQKWTDLLSLGEALLPEISVAHSLTFFKFVVNNDILDGVYLVYALKNRRSIDLDTSDPLA